MKKPKAKPKISKFYGYKCSRNGCVSGYGETHESAYKDHLDKHTACRNRQATLELLKRNYVALLNKNKMLQSKIEDAGNQLTELSKFLYPIVSVKGWSESAGRDVLRITNLLKQ